MQGWCFHLGSSVWLMRTYHEYGVRPHLSLAFGCTSSNIIDAVLAPIQGASHFMIATHANKAALRIAAHWMVRGA